MTHATKECKFFFFFFLLALFSLAERRAQALVFPTARPPAATHTHAAQNRNKEFWWRQRCASTAVGRWVTMQTRWATAT